MTGLIAAGIGAAGAIASAALPKLMGGSGGTQGSQQMSQNSNTISGPVPGSPYEVFQNEQLARISDLSSRPYQPYDVSKMFAGFNQDQLGAFQGVRNAQDIWQPSFNKANAALTGVGGAAYDPVSAGAGAFGAAGSAPGALDSANPYFQQASQTLPSVIDDYFNPYVDKAINAANKLQSQNFLQNIMPGLTSQFVSSGGGLGSKQYGRSTDWALSNLNRSIGDTTQAAKAAGYNTAAAQAQADLARIMGIGTSSGQLALGDIGAQTNLGTAMGQNAALGAQTGINQANAWAGLGTGSLNNRLTASNALLNIGNQEQQQAQLPLTAAYQQFLAGQQDPYAKVGWASQTANQYQWPMRQNTSTDSIGSTSSSSSQQGSPLGTGLGIAATVGSLIPRGGSSGTMIPGQTLPDGTIQIKTGGYIRNRFAHGGYLGLSRASMAPKARPMWGEPALISHGFDNFDRASEAPYARPAFRDTYANGGTVSDAAVSIPPIVEYAPHPAQALPGVGPLGVDPLSAFGIDALLDRRMQQMQPAGPSPAQIAAMNIFDAGSANGATGNDSGSVGNAGDGTAGGVSGSGGVGGSASSDAGVGGSAAAGVGGDDGGTYAYGGYLGLSRTSDAPKARPAFRDYYAKGGAVSAAEKKAIIKAVHQHDKQMHGGHFTKVKLATGGAVPVMKVMRQSTQRSLKANAKQKKLRRAASTSVPLDLSPRGGFFNK